MQTTARIYKIERHCQTSSKSREGLHDQYYANKKNIDNLTMTIMSEDKERTLAAGLSNWYMTSADIMKRANIDELRSENYKLYSRIEALLGISLSELEREEKVIKAEFYIKREDGILFRGELYRLRTKKEWKKTLN